LVRFCSDGAAIPSAASAPQTRTASAHCAFDASGCRLSDGGARHWPRCCQSGERAGKSLVLVAHCAAVHVAGPGFGAGAVLADCALGASALAWRRPHLPTHASSALTSGAGIVSGPCSRQCCHCLHAMATAALGVVECRGGIAATPYPSPNLVQS